MSELRVANIKGSGGGALNSISLPTGTILQVVQTVKTDVFAGTPGAKWMDIPSFSVSITPKSSTNKILILVDLKMADTASATTMRARLLRGTTPVYIGDAASTRPQVMSHGYMGNSGSDTVYGTIQMGGTYLDSPATTSQVTYKVQIGGDGDSSTIYVNRTQNDRDTAYYDGRTASSITLMEVSA